MGQSARTLRDRILRDAIVNVLRGITDPGLSGKSLVHVGLVSHVAVEGDRVVVELVATGDQRPSEAGIVTDVRQRLTALPELAQAEIAVLWREPSAAHARRRPPADLRERRYPNVDKIQ